MDALAAVIAVAGVRAPSRPPSTPPSPGASRWTLSPARPSTPSPTGPRGCALPTARHPALPGDIVLLPDGTAHTLASAPGASTQPFDHLAAEQALAAGGELRRRQEVQTRILCASTTRTLPSPRRCSRYCPTSSTSPSRACTGPRGHPPTDRAPGFGRPQPAAAAVLNRLVDVLLIQVARVCVTIGASSSRSSSWLTGSTTPSPGPRCSHPHTQPERGWTITSLAPAPASPRATLARRFAALVGDPRPPT